MNSSTLILLTLTIILPTQAIRALETSNFKKYEETQLFEEYSDLFPQQKILPRCGQALTAENGAIFHEVFEAIKSSERCTWVIGIPGAVGYTINIQHLGFSNNQSNATQGLVVTGVRLGPVMTTHIPQQIGSFNVTRANILVVTFYSTLPDDPLSSGFALQYEAIRIGSLQKTANASSHRVFESDTFDFKYPAIGTSYANYELSSFVFPPSGNIYSGGNTNVYYKRGGLEICLDALYIYTLNVADISAGIWESKGRICHADVTAQITSNEIILVLFQTDGSQVFTGFSLTYTAC